MIDAWIAIMKDARFACSAKIPKVDIGHAAIDPKKMKLCFIVCMMIFMITGCGELGSTHDQIATLLPEDTDWRYIASFTQLQSVHGSWTGSDFDDTTWQIGKGPFGSKDGAAEFEDGSVAKTVLPLEEDGQRIPTYLFRADFNLDSSQLESLDSAYSAYIFYDDAILVYVNGVEVLSENRPLDGYESIMDFGATHRSDLPQEALLTIPSDLLHQGANVIAVELRQGSENSSDIWFDMSALDAASLDSADARDGTIVIGAAETQSEMLVTWQGEGDEGSVAYHEVDDSALANVDPGAPVDGIGAGGFASKRVEATASKGPREGTTTFTAVLDGLESGHSYVYRVEDSAESAVYGFSVPSIEEGYSFLANGDPQIIDAEDNEPILRYLDLVNYAIGDGGSRFPVDFLMTLGDQSDDAEDAALFERYLSCGLFRSIPLAPIRGNHEAAADLYEHFFPQLSLMEGKEAEETGDYWFWRDRTLFLCLNSNKGDPAAHSRFIAEALESIEKAYGKPTWIIAAFHHAPYSVGNHADSDSTLARRETLVPILEDAGVDLVLNGHDHVYTRTYPMWQGKPLTSASADTSTADGIVYLTLGSSTGTKYYDHTESDTSYMAFSNPEDTPSIARIDVTDEELKISVYSLGADDEIGLLDQATITQSAETEALKEAA